MSSFKDHFFVATNASFVVTNKYAKFSLPLFSSIFFITLLGFHSKSTKNPRELLHAVAELMIFRDFFFIFVLLYPMVDQIIKMNI